MNGEYLIKENDIQMDGIGKVTRIKGNTFTTDTGREFEVPVELDDVTVEALNDWIEHYSDAFFFTGNWVGCSGFVESQE